MAASSADGPLGPIEDSATLGQTRDESEEAPREEEEEDEVDECRFTRGSPDLGRDEVSGDKRLYHVDKKKTHF